MTVGEKEATSGNAVDYTNTWLGFNVVEDKADTSENEATKLVVLAATDKTSILGKQSEGTCTLAQER